MTTWNDKINYNNISTNITTKIQTKISTIFTIIFKITMAKTISIILTTPIYITISKIYLQQYI